MDAGLTRPPSSTTSSSSCPSRPSPPSPLTHKGLLLIAQTTSYPSRRFLKLFVGVQPTSHSSLQRFCIALSKGEDETGMRTAMPHRNAKILAWLVTSAVQRIESKDGRLFCNLRDGIEGLLVCMQEPAFVNC